MAKAPWHDINAPGFGFINPIVEKKKAQEAKKLAEQERQLDEFCEQQEIIASKNPEFSNESWRHADPELAENRPDVIFPGDTIILCGSYKDMVEGAGIDAVIRDTTNGRFKDVLKLKNARLGKEGTYEIEWTVELPADAPKDATYGYELHYSGSYGSKYSKTIELPISYPTECDFVEIPDLNFHHNSAVPVIDEPGEFEASLTAAFAYAREHEDKTVVVFGHTDTSGDPAYNYDLSQWRAEAVKAILDNDKEKWLDIMDIASKAEDIQRILKTLTAGYAWSCDPGEVDNILGSKTKQAIKDFQSQYNQRFSKNIAVDGIIGEQTNGAFFTVIRNIVKDAYSAGDPARELPKLTYGYEGKGIYPCGESFPVEQKDRDNYRSAENRRVEIVFFTKGEEPKLLEPVEKKKVEKKEAPVYDQKQVVKKPIPVTAKKPATDATDKLVFYCPSTDEYIECLGSDAISAIIELSDEADELAKDIQEFRELGDTDKQFKKAKALEKKLETVLGTKTQVKAHDAFEELLLCRRDKNKRFSKSLVYVPKNRMRNRVNGGGGFTGMKRSRYDEARELAEFMSLEDTKSAADKANPLNSVKANFWKAKGKDASVWKFTAQNEDGNNDVLADNDHFSASAEAQFLRFAAGASVSADVTSLLKGEPKLTVGGDASVTFSLAEGTASGAFHIPNKKGVNILGLFTSSDKLQGFVHEGRVCSLLFKIALEGYGFVGVSAQAMLSLPQIDFTQMEPTSRSDRSHGSSSPATGRKKDAYVSAGGGAGATATVGGSIAASVEWKGHDKPKFASLGEVKGTAEASAGIAIELAAEAGLRNGEFRVKLGAQAVAGIGGKLGTEIGLGIDEGYKFIVYIFRSFDYHFAVEVVGDAFDACVKMGIAKITDVADIVDDAFVRGFDLVKSAFDWGTKHGIPVKRRLVGSINSGAKDEEIRDNVPEANGAILLGIMEKPEEDDFDAIIRILRPATQHELKSILRVVGTSNPEIAASKPPRGAPGYPDWQGKALQEGVKILHMFGSELDNFDNYENRLMEIWNEKKIGS